jgi:hypothetical protein
MGFPAHHLVSKVPTEEWESRSLCEINEEVAWSGRGLLGRYYYTGTPLPGKMVCPLPASSLVTLLRSPYLRTTERDTEPMALGNGAREQRPHGVLLQPAGPATS